MKQKEMLNSLTGGIKSSYNTQFPNLRKRENLIVNGFVEEKPAPIRVETGDIVYPLYVLMQLVVFNLIGVLVPRGFSLDVVTDVGYTNGWTGSNLTTKCSYIMNTYLFIVDFKDTSVRVVGHKRHML